MSYQKKYSYLAWKFFSRGGIASVDLECMIIETQEESKMNTFDMDTIDFANMMFDMVADDIVERIEPCDEAGIHPLDWAMVAGIENEIFEEMYPDADARG